MIESGASWSGRERNSVFVNLGNNRFADVSALSGLDLPDDGRCLVQCDWDGDGALDLWFKNRTGPVLRFWRNERASAATGGPRTLSLLLEGKACNRDAVGARVTVRAGEASFVREVVAGDGYLSQSTRWLVFGLGPAKSIDEVVVRWPGGESETVEGLEIGGRYRVVQGDGARSVSPASPVASALAPPSPIDSAPTLGLTNAQPKSTTLVLRTPLALPATFNRAVGGVRPGRARLIQVWTHDCGDCVEELVNSARLAREWSERRLDVTALCVDEPKNRPAAESLLLHEVAAHATGPGIANVMASAQLAELVELLMRHIVARPGPLVLPLSVLVDSTGTAQVVYLGPVSSERVLADVQSYGLQAHEPRSRSAFRGVWLFGQVRDLAGLSRALRERGLTAEADFYRDMLRMGVGR